MANICEDPRRRCLPLAKWPAPDRRAWDAATSDGGLLGEAGLAVNWSAGTCSRVIQSYGRFLTFLEYRGELDHTRVPEERASRECVVAYVEELRQQCASVTVYGYILNLERALHVMVPDEDLGWLRRMASRLKARARPSRNKRIKLVPAENLFDLGMRLMQRALEADDLGLKRRAVLYRDGLLIAFLSTRLFRRRSFTNLEIGQHVVRVGDGYCLRLEPQETKNRRPYEAPLPENLTAYMDFYLERMRPVLLSGRTSDRLWITYAGTPMASDSMYLRLCKATERELGRPINPHLFRDCAATSMAIDDPEHIYILQPLLGHKSMATSEMHYNQAKAIEAARQYQSLIHRKRSEITRRSDRRR